MRGDGEVRVDVPPGTRFSTRSAGPWPTSRSEQVRLSLPQRTAVGANEPGW